MATPYELPYDVFLDNIDDPQILYPKEDETEIEYDERIQDTLLSMLKRAVIKFKHSATKLDRDDTNKIFLYDLREVEIEIIGMMMLKEYYKKRLNFLASVKRSFKDKDWQSHDISSHMGKFQNLISETNSEIKTLIADNSFTDDDGSYGWIDENE
jgi:hypothetical protein